MFTREFMISNFLVKFFLLSGFDAVEVIDITVNDGDFNWNTSGKEEKAAVEAAFDLLEKDLGSPVW